MLYKTGIISEVKTGYAKVFFEEEDLVTDWWPVTRLVTLKDKISYPLNINEHVACICDELCEKGVVIGAIHNDKDAVDTGAGAGKFRMKFEDGTVLMYNKNASELRLTVKGKVIIEADDDVTVTTDTKAIITAGTDAEITAAGKVKVTATGNVEVVSSANVEATATTQAKITAPLVTITGNLVITGNISFGGTLAGPAGSGLAFSGDTMNVKKINATDEVKEGTIVLGSHTHSGVDTGGGVSGPPVP